MAKFVSMNTLGIKPSEDAPDQGSVIYGNPQFKSWTLDKAEGGLCAGVWESTPGKWRFENTHWEYCHILAGLSVVTEDEGVGQTVRHGDSFILRAGFKGA